MSWVNHLACNGRGLSLSLMVVLWCAGTVQAHNTPGPPSQLKEHYTDKAFDVRNGLPSSKINALFQDRHGFLWIGTDGGVSRFDGHEFTNFSLTDGLAGNYVSGICEDTLNDAIWVSTSLGLTRITHDSIRSFRQDSGRKSMDVKSMTIDNNGTVWAITIRHLIEIRGDVLKSHPLKQVHSELRGYQVSFDGDRLLLATSRGVLTFEDGSFDWLWKSDSRVLIMSMKAGKEKDIWFSMHSGQLMHLKDQTVEEKSFPGQEDFFIFGKICLAGDRLLLAHENDVSIFSNNAFMGRLSDVAHISDGVPHDVLIDKEENIWLATSRGLVRYCRTTVSDPVIVMGEADSLFSGFTILDQGSDGTIISGDAGGMLYEVNGLKATLLEHKNIFFSGMVSALSVEDKHRLWMGTLLGGFMKCDTSGCEKYNKAKAGLMSGRIYCGMRTRDGRMLFGAQSSVVVCEKDGRIHNMSSDDLLGKNVLSFFEDESQRIWIGTQEGVLVLEGDQIVPYSKKLGLENILVNGFAQRHPDTLLIGTKGKGILMLVEDEKGQHTHWINKYSGLENEMVISMKFDPRGALWVVTNSGLLRTHLEPHGALRVQRFGADQGVDESVWDFVDMMIDQDQQLWVTSGRNLWRIDAMACTDERPTQPPLILRSADHLDYHWPVSNSTGTPTFAFDDQHIRVSFASPDLQYGSGLQYSWRLIGSTDTTWRKGSAERTATFMGLAPGAYRLEVRAKSPVGSWSMPVGWAFQVATPFWRQVWVIALLAALGMVGVWLLYRQGVQYALRRQDEKNELQRVASESRLMAFRAQTNPHFIFNAMSSIQHLIIMDDRPAALTYLAKFSKLLRSILDHTRQPFISVAEELELLQTYIAMEKLRFEKEFELKVTLDKNIDPAHVYLPSMIIQPFVENAIIHGLLPQEQPGQLSIRLQMRERNLLVEVEDSGIGREAAAIAQADRQGKHKSHGTEIALERIRLLNAQPNSKAAMKVIDLYTNEGLARGTKVTLWLPCEKRPDQA